MGFVVSDKKTQGLLISEHWEWCIHEGLAYEASGRKDIANGGTYDIFVSVPADGCDMLFEVSAESECSYLLNEAVAVSGNGTEVTAYNRDRNSINTADTKVYHTPTITDAGATIRTRHWGNGKADGGANRGGWCTMLKESSHYLLRIVNETTSANYVNWCLRWCEN